MTDVEETRALKQALSSYYHYKEYALGEFWMPRMLKWASLSDSQKQNIPWYKEYLDELKACILKNAYFYEMLVQQSLLDLGCNSSPGQWGKPSLLDMNKAILMFTQIMREWSLECQDERNILLTRLRNFLDYELPRNKSDRSMFKVLVPGAGLSRLVVDLVSEGFHVEGNEISYHMLLLSRFILNGAIPHGSIVFYPFAHTFSHQLSRELQLRPIMIPDIDISSKIDGKGEMSMSAGSFVDLYGPPAGIKWSGCYSAGNEMTQFRKQSASSVNMVITNFFIDTGNNILDYLETISHVLKNGGYWINFGPLMYHFENDTQVETLGDFDPYTGEIVNIDYSVPVKGLELSRDDILKVASEKYNFDIVFSETQIRSGYGRDPIGIAMLGYMCNYWV